MATEEVSKGAVSEKVDTSDERLGVYLSRVETALAEQRGDSGPPIKLDLSRVSREALEELACAAIMFDDLAGFPGGPVSAATNRVHAERKRDGRETLRQIDTLLDEMIQLTDEQRWAFVDQFAGAARRAGISPDQAAATLCELGRMVANPK
jgi:hypothetical protein